MGTIVRCSTELSEHLMQNQVVSLLGTVYRRKDPGPLSPPVPRWGHKHGVSEALPEVVRERHQVLYQRAWKMELNVRILCKLLIIIPKFSWP
jgi:hypothetical protein